MENNLVTRFFSIVDASRWNALADFFHPDIVYERPGYKPIVGLNQLLRFYQEERSIKSGIHHIEHIVLDGQYGACWGRFIGLRKDESPIDESFADVYIFEDEKIKHRRTHFFRPGC